MSEFSPFVHRLKQARKASSLTQTELGIRVGFEASSASSRMNHYEKGRHLPDLETMKRMAKELNVPLAYFFCEGDDEAELLKLFNRMTPTQKNECLTVVKYQLSKVDDVGK